MDYSNLIQCIEISRRGTSITYRQFNFSGHIGRMNSVSGKLKDEFYLMGRYYGSYDLSIPETDEWKFIDKETVLVVENADTDFRFHHHIIVPSLIEEEYRIELEDGKVYIDGNLVTRESLLWWNNWATEKIKEKFNVDYVFENYALTNNFIVL